MTKIETIRAAAEGKGCLGKAENDEPVFVLRGQDIFAALLVREWADRLESSAQRAGELTGKRQAKIADARRIALAMDAWRAGNEGGKIPD